MFIKRSTLIAKVAFCLLLVSACTTTKSTLPYISYSTHDEDYINLPVNIVLTVDQLVDGELSNYQYSERIFLQNTFLDSFLKEQAFLSMSTYQGKYPHTLSVTYRTDFQGDTSSSVVGAFISALTLFLIPITETIKHTVEFEIFEGKKAIRKYVYTDIRKSSVRTRFQQQEEHEKAISNFIEHFLTDLRKDEILIPINKPKDQIT